MNIEQLPDNTFAITVTIDDNIAHDFLFDDDDTVTYYVAPYTLDDTLFFDIAFDSTSSDRFDTDEFIAQFGLAAYNTVTAC